MRRETPVVDIAIQYLAEGWMCIPVPLGEKNPGFNGWQETLLNTPELLRRHFNGARQNIGTLLGSVSGNLIDVDLDFKECLPFARIFLPNTRQFGRKSNPVSHWLYRVMDATNTTFRCPEPPGSDDRVKVVEIRGNKLQTVFPGSVHESGEPIGWMGVHQHPITEISFAELRRLCGRVAAGAVFARVWPREQGNRHQCALALAGFLLRAGFTVEEAERFIGAIAKIAGNDAEIHTKAVKDTKKNMDAGKKVTGWKSLFKELGGLKAIENIPAWLGYTGQTTEAAVPEFIPVEKDTREVMQFTRMGDLLSEHEEEMIWLVADHLPMGGDSLLVAKPKVGKSTLARCLALAVARGEDFLGCHTSQGSVFYLALEEKRAEVRRHFRAMGATADDPIFIFCASSPADGLAQLREAMADEKPVLVIVDPLFRFVRMKDGNDYAAVTNSLEPLHNLARETGAHVLAVHHLGKGDRQGGDAVLGSTALFATVDSLLMTKRNEKYRTLSSIQRYGTDLEEITLQYDEQTRTLSAGMTRDKADTAEATKAILEFLGNQTEAIDERTIQEAIEGRKGTKSKALHQLRDAHEVEWTGTGKRGDPYLYKKAGIAPPNIYMGGAGEKPESDLTHTKHTTICSPRLFMDSGQSAEIRGEKKTAFSDDVPREDERL